MEPLVGETHLELGGSQEIRMFALVPAEMQAQILHQLDPLGAQVDFVFLAADISPLRLSRKAYQVALLPAALSHDGWWLLWGQIALLTPRPEILVYAQSASFQLWSGVLEMGGCDVIVEPFSGEELRRAVIRAALGFAARCGSAEE